MHFELLVEDESGKRMLERLVPKILNAECTYRVHSYRGIGRIPKGLTPKTDPAKRILLDQLPRLLSGYGRAFPVSYPFTVVVVCDLDNRNTDDFLCELLSVLDSAAQAPTTRFCIAVEEGEAWLLGDLNAIKMAYPKAKAAVLGSYKNDSICGTWETLADAVYPGGSLALIAQGHQVVGQEKSRWAETITPFMDVRLNRSPSFVRFVRTLEDLASHTW